MTAWPVTWGTPTKPYCWGRIDLLVRLTVILTDSWIVQWPKSMSLTSNSRSVCVTTAWTVKVTGRTWWRKSGCNLLSITDIIVINLSLFSVIFEIINASIIAGLYPSQMALRDCQKRGRGGFTAFTDQYYSHRAAVVLPSRNFPIHRGVTKASPKN